MQQPRLPAGQKLVKGARQLLQHEATALGPPPRPGPGLVRGQEETTTEQSCRERVAVPAGDYPDKSHCYRVVTLIISSF